MIREPKLTIQTIDDLILTRLKQTSEKDIQLHFPQNRLYLDSLKS